MNPSSENALFSKHTSMYGKGTESGTIIKGYKHTATVIVADKRIYEIDSMAIETYKIARPKRAHSARLHPFH